MISHSWNKAGEYLVNMREQWWKYPNLTKKNKGGEKDGTGKKSKGNQRC